MNEIYLPGQNNLTEGDECICRSYDVQSKKIHPWKYELQSTNGNSMEGLLDASAIEHNVFTNGGSQCY